jgi:Domain of unknown function (DUF4126)
VFEALTALGLATAAGLNAYIPLLLVGLVSRFTGALDLSSSYDWLENGWVLGGLGVLLAVEIVLDKVPVVDSVNDMIQTVIRPLSGGVTVTATAAAADVDASWAEDNAWLGWLVGIVGALVVHGVKSAARPGINLATLGAGAPVVSTTEDATAAAFSLSALFAPLLVLVGLVLLGWLAFVLLRQAQRRRPSYNEP